MAAAHGGLVFLAVLLAIGAAASAEASSVVVGLAKCADCTRKNMKAAEAFKGLHVAIKCKSSNGEYESKAVGELDAATGAFSVPLAADSAAATDCFAQLHSAANVPCPGQEPSKIVPLSEGTFGVVAGKTRRHVDASPECASATLCGPIKKKLFDHFHKKPVPPKPMPKPQPKPQPKPECASATLCGPIKKKLFDHFHKKPVPPKPMPKPEPKPQPRPDYHPIPPTPTYGHPTPIYHPPVQH